MHIYPDIYGQTYTHTRNSSFTQYFYFAKIFVIICSHLNLENLRRDQMFSPFFFEKIEDGMV